MNPFLTQQRAFDLAQAGDWGGATAQFAKALEGFDWLIGEATPRALVVSRARLIPDLEESAEDIAEKFLQALPDWLRQLHFEIFYKALTNYEFKPARMHWRFLVMAATLPAFASAINLDLLREQVCQRSQVTYESLLKGVTERAGAMRRAERILAADRDNQTARRLAIHGYTSEVQAALERLIAGRKQDQPTRALDRLNGGKRQRLHGLHKTVKRLRQHLRLSRSKAEADIEEMIFSYRHLCHYHIGIGELETAIRLARRARRLRPEDLELRKWARHVRQLRRRR